MHVINLNRCTATRILRHDPHRVFCLDTETTGTNPLTDEILSLSIADASGTLVFDHLFHPVSKRKWPAAERINGINPTDLHVEKTLSAYAEELKQLSACCDLLVGYNLQFDMTFLEYGGSLAFSHLATVDIMAAFTALHGKPGKHGAKKWESLSSCAKYYGITYKPHSSSEDARATAQCFAKLLLEVASSTTP